MARSNASPPKAKATQIPAAITVPRTAIARRPLGGVLWLSAAKIAAVPIGSMITAKVTRS
jgi:hypothetical protein